MAPAGTTVPAAAPIPQTPPQTLGETACEFVWPSAEPSGCSESQWCVPQLGTAACFEKGSGVDGNVCLANEGCAEGYLCLEQYCTALCLEQSHCGEGTACVQLHDSRGASLGYGRCRPTTDEACCSTSNGLCGCYDPCPFPELVHVCAFEEGEACCYSGLVEEGLPLCVCRESLPDTAASCADYVEGQARARGTSLAVVETCSGITGRSGL